ncbi:hypothetical protein ACHHYP_10938 [Achlya hypogyna]|uniref:Secreted protein n=1 Tax=Achlya hypogyna TaxID=1202772 RepID=A0A1V9YK92_ACHHY|nr:hypothetical protein ACHHYP_10938 [Achlya hypogyna]
MILRCMVWLGLLATAAVVDAQVCCHVCLQTLGPSSYDPTVFSQCDKKKPGCCFCDSQLTIASPAFTSSQAAGEWQKVAWSDVSKVTSLSIATANEAAAHPQLTPLQSPVAQDAKGNYLFCSDTPGQIIFRGWGPIANNYPSNCTAISSQLSITITAGTAKCADSTPTTKPGGSSATGSGSSASGKTTPSPTSSVKCDPNRGYVVDNTCKCLSDYSGPPTCDGMALWKILVSVAGGLAALFSIAVSIRQFLLIRKRKREEEELNNVAEDQSSKNFDTMYAMPASHEYYESAATASRYTEGSRNNDRQRPSMPESAGSRPSMPDSAADPRFQPRESKEYTL